MNKEINKLAKLGYPSPAIKDIKAAMGIIVHTIYLLAISQSDGSARSGSRIENDRLKRNSSSANKMETAVIAHIKAP